MSILLPVGKVSKLFGLDGGVLVSLYDAFPGNVDKEEPLFVRVDGLAVPLFAECFERRGPRGALIRFSDIDTPARAEELLGQELLLVPAAAKYRQSECAVEEGEGEIFFEDLVGYRASVSEEGRKPVAGTVAAFIDSELNPLLQIKTDGKELLIPAADRFIDHIDTTTREIFFTVPVGLIELYI